jgi:hypothetical protein
VILTRSNLVVRELVDRRVLAAVQLTDASTGLPIVGPAQIRPVSARLVNPTGQPPVDIAVGFDGRTLRIQRNRSGLFVFFTAPLFTGYTDAFENPPLPPELRQPLGGNQFLDLVLRVRVEVTDPGANYLPRMFTIDLPRSLVAAEANSVLNTVQVPVFPAPNAMLDGSAALRVRVEQADDASVLLPGVLIEVFRRPRAQNDLPIGRGMTEWRGRTRGEALVVVGGLRRFRVGGNGALVNSESIEVEAARDPAFTGAIDTLPDVDAIADRNNPSMIRPPLRPQNSSITTFPAQPLDLRPGQELTVRIQMP